jgi:hypothetical protein
MNNSFTAQDYEFFEGFLENFEVAKRKTETETLARCPDPDHLHTNGDGNPSLSIGLAQNGRGPTILLNCLSQNCDNERILYTVGLELKDLYPEKNGTPGRHKQQKGALPGCTLEEYAAYKNLPIEFLAGDSVGLEDDEYWCPISEKKVPAVYIPYVDENGEELEECATWRIGLRKTDPDTRIRRRSKKRRGRLALYGLHGLVDARAAGYVLLVEGESDCHTAWYYEIPAVGVPGAQNWRDDWADHLDGIPKIYVMVEPDAAGGDLWKAVSGCEALAGRVRRAAFG